MYKMPINYAKQPASFYTNTRPRQYSSPAQYNSVPVQPNYPSQGSRKGGKTKRRNSRKGKSRKGKSRRARPRRHH